MSMLMTLLVLLRLRRLLRLTLLLFTDAPPSTLKDATETGEPGTEDWDGGFCPRVF